MRIGITRLTKPDKEGKIREYVPCKRDEDGVEGLICPETGDFICIGPADGGRVMEPKTEITHITTPVAKYTLDFNTGFIKAKPTSIDPKPLWMPHGTIIQEDDTKDYYIFDANDKMWVKLFSEWIKLLGLKDAAKEEGEE